MAWRKRRNENRNGEMAAYQAWRNAANSVIKRKIHRQNVVKWRETAAAYGGSGVIKSAQLSSSSRSRGGGVYQRYLNM
jgi:hypothetical protein